MKKSFYFLFILLLIICSCDQQVTIQQNDTTITMNGDEFISSVGQAYIYAYPIVLMDLTKQVITNNPVPHLRRAMAPINQIGHMRYLPDPRQKSVVKPNVDTYYSIAWLDLSEGPQLFTIPESKRYYLLQFMNAYTEVIGTIGTTHTGNDATNIVLSLESEANELDNDIPIISSTTPMVC